MTKILCLIPARSGSKGIINKNIRIMINKPLLAWSIEQAKNTEYYKRGDMRIVVSTDSEKYKDIGLKWGAEVPFLRPKELSKDNTTDLMFPSPGGAETTTFLAPAVMCPLAPASSRNRPVDSSTVSTPISPQGRAAGSLSLKVAIVCPLTIKLASEVSILPSNRPCILSYLSKCASVVASVKSFMATISIPASLIMARKVTLPILPNPFIATFIFPITFIF